MPVIAKKYRVRLQESNLTFSETYPTELSVALPMVEFDSVIRKVNEDLATEVRDNLKNFRNWSILTISLCCVGVGFFLTPVIFVKGRRQRKELKRFWERLRTYLGEINRKTYLRRNIEWKLIEDKRKLKGRDVVNPLLAYRIEVIHRIQKMKVRITNSQNNLTMTAIAMAGANGSSSSRRNSTTSTPSQSNSPPIINTPLLAKSRANWRNSKQSDSDEDSEDDDQNQGKIVIEEGLLPSYADDVLIEEDEEDYVNDDLGNFGSVSSTGAGSYSRGSFLASSTTKPMVASIYSARDSTERQPRPEQDRIPSIGLVASAKIASSDDGEVTSQKNAKAKATLPTAPSMKDDLTGSELESERISKKRNSRVRFTGLFDDDEEEGGEHFRVPNDTHK